MFDWHWPGLEKTEADLDTMRAEFGQMLDSGRHIFGTAAVALLGGTDPDVVRDGLYEADRRINRAEQRIRREIMTFASHHGPAEFPTCLVLMSLVKDAERIGDYAKNVFQLAERIPIPPTGTHRETLIQLKDRILELMSVCRQALDTHSKELAVKVIREAHEIQSACENEVRQLVRIDAPTELASAYVLAYRYFKRASGHTSNVASSVVEPLDKLDFPAKPGKAVPDDG